MDERWINTKEMTIESQLIDKYSEFFVFLSKAEFTFKKAQAEEGNRILREINLLLKAMNEIKEGSEGYARFIVGNKKIERGVTAWVKITSVNGEYVEFQDNDKFKYKVAKNKFSFVKNIM